MLRTGQLSQLGCRGHESCSGSNFISKHTLFSTDGLSQVSCFLHICTRTRQRSSKANASGSQPHKHKTYLCSRMRPSTRRRPQLRDGPTIISTTRLVGKRRHLNCRNESQNKSRLKPSLHRRTADAMCSLNSEFPYHRHRTTTSTAAKVCT